MTDRQALTQQIIDHEGLRLRPYDDATGEPVRPGDRVEGHLTIGVGHNLTSLGITQAQAVQILDADLDDAIHDLLSFTWFPVLDTIRQRAVIDVRFNVGHDGFRTFTQFIAAMARKNYVQASLELQNSRWSRQVQPARVTRLRAMIETGEE